MDNFEFSNPKLNDWTQTGVKNKITIQDNPLLDHLDPDDPLFNDPALDELLLQDPKLASPAVTGDSLLGQGVLASDQNVLGLRTSNAILKQDILELDRALLNLQPKVMVDLETPGIVFTTLHFYVTCEWAQ